MQDTLLINLFYLLTLGFLGTAAIVLFRYKYSKQRIGKVWVQMYPISDAPIMALCKFENNRVQVKYDGVHLFDGKKYKDIESNTKVVEYECTDDDLLSSLYPFESGWLARLVSVPIKKVILREGDFVPISRKGEDKSARTIDPEREKQKTNVSFFAATDIIAEASEKERQIFIKAAAKMVEPKMIYIALFVCVLCAVLTVYFVYGMRDDMSAVRYAVGQ